jgi:hypothetical protein
VSLATPPKLRRLQEALYTKAKQEPDYRFYLLYDKVYRADILAHAYALSKQHGGAPGVDGVTFEDIEAAGVERWLAAVGEAVRAETYRPQPVRRVLIPKPGGTGERPFDPRRSARVGHPRPSTTAMRVSQRSGAVGGVWLDEGLSDRRRQTPSPKRALELPAQPPDAAGAAAQDVGGLQPGALGGEGRTMISCTFMARSTAPGG